jgi:hypothetical protein
LNLPISFFAGQALDRLGLSLILQAGVEDKAEIRRDIVAEADVGAEIVRLMLVLFGMSFSRASIVPAGSLAKASSVGAKTVKGPGPESVSTRPAALTAVTKVPKLPTAMAVSTMFFSSEGADDPAKTIVPMATKRTRITYTCIFLIKNLQFLAVLGAPGR